MLVSAGIRLRLAAGVVAAALCTAAPAEIYKWIDEDGGVHFSERKPAGTDAETVHIHYTKPSAEAQQQLKKTLEEDQKAREERMKAEEDQAREQRNVAVKQRNCEKARAHLAELQRVVRLFHVDNEGNRVRVGEEERQADIKKMEQIIAENCSG